MTTTSDSIGDYPWTRIFLGIVVFVMLFIAANYFVGAWWFAPPAAADGFGDVFGLSNALFSGLALAAVIITLLMQRLELKLQRLELSATREELKGQKEQMEIQNATLTRQEFESGFFNLLSLRSTMLDGFTYEYVTQTVRYDLSTDGAAIEEDAQVVKGRLALDRIALSLTDRMRTVDGFESDVRDAYTEFYNRCESILGPYFRSLYHLLKYVDISGEDDDRKDYYASIIRSQLPRTELLLLYYNCVSDMGKIGMRRLVGVYNILKYLPVSNIRNEKHRSLLDGATYKPQV